MVLSRSSLPIQPTTGGQTASTFRTISRTTSPAPLPFRPPYISLLPAPSEKTLSEILEDIPDFRRDVYFTVGPDTSPHHLVPALQSLFHANLPADLAVVLAVDMAELACSTYLTSLFDHLAAATTTTPRRSLPRDTTSASTSSSSSWTSVRLQATVELLRTRPCPRWHEDKIALRTVTTYVGPGTEYIADKDRIYTLAMDLRRRWSSTAPLPPLPTTTSSMSSSLSRLLFTVASQFPSLFENTVDVRAGAEVYRVPTGDALILFGTKWPGRGGCGVVHRSPDVDVDVDVAGGGQGRAPRDEGPPPLRLVTKMDVVGQIRGESGVEPPTCGNEDTVSWNPNPNPDTDPDPDWDVKPSLSDLPSPRRWPLPKWLLRLLYAFF